MIDLSFVATALIVVLIPGTGVIYTVFTGVSKGRAAATWAAFGCTLGILPHLLATILGLAAIMNTSAVIFQFVKYLGVFYLMYLAVTALRDKSSMNFSSEIRPKGCAQIVGKAVMINLLNPKLTLFFMAFLPQFVNQNSSTRLLQMSILSLLFMGMTFVVFAAYGFLANQFRHYVIGSKRVQTWIRRITAGAFASLGLRLATSER